MNAKRLTIKRIETDDLVDLAGCPIWDTASDISIGRYWSGIDAPVERDFAARMLWSAHALYVRFDARQAEPLVVASEPIVTEKTMGLWDRDVCEIFIAPNIERRNEYFEFEVAPTGEWLDLGIITTSDDRATNVNYVSGMTAAASVAPDRVVMTIKLPWAAFGKVPSSGDVWHGNIFRCVGKGENRGYLAWQPTETPAPNFHVPEKFGEFEFVG